MVPSSRSAPMPSGLPGSSIFADRDYVDMALPIRTRRLHLRSGRVDDLDSLHARRNQPAVQQYQSWTHPYPREDAAELLAGLVKMPGPTLGEWWMLMIDLPGATDGDLDSGDDGEVRETVGDIALHFDESGYIAEIGYNLAPEHWGHGYATEAVAAVVDRLFTKHTELLRLQAHVHPDNLASAGVVERCGFEYEGQTRMSFVPTDDNQDPSDDRIYSLLRSDWQSWTARPTQQPTDVHLTKVTAENVRAVSELITHKSQEELVSPVVHSLAHALVPPVRDGEMVKPWYRAVEADGELVGFVMLAEPGGSRSETYLWRMLIDRRHQRRGIGRRVLDAVVEQAKQWRSDRLSVSWVPGPGSPERFYLGYGFTAVGPADESGEVPGSLTL